MADDQLTPARPVAPIDYTNELDVPLLGIFGNDDQNPTADQVNRTEAVLKRPGFSLVGFARRDWEDQDFEKVVYDAVKEHARTPFQDEVWQQLAQGIQAGQTGQTTVIIVCLVVYGVLGLLSDFVVRVLERRALAWRRGLGTA